MLPYTQLSHKKILGNYRLIKDFGDFELFDKIRIIKKYTQKKGEMNPGWYIMSPGRIYNIDPVEEKISIFFAGKGIPYHFKFNKKDVRFMKKQPMAIGNDNFIKLKEPKPKKAPTKVKTKVKAKPVKNNMSGSLILKKKRKKTKSKK